MQKVKYLSSDLIKSNGKMFGCRVESGDLLFSNEKIDKIPNPRKTKLIAQHVYLLGKEILTITFSKQKLWATVSSRDELTGKWKNEYEYSYDHRMRFGTEIQTSHAAYRFFILQLMRSEIDSLFMFYNQSLAMDSFQFGNNTIQLGKLSISLWPAVNEITVKVLYEPLVTYKVQPNLRQLIEKDFNKDS